MKKFIFIIWILVWKGLVQGPTLGEGAGVNYYKQRKYLLSIFVIIFVYFVYSCSGGGGSGGGSGDGEETTEIAAFYISSVGQPLKIGDTFTAEVTLDTDDIAVTAVSAYITFPSDILEVDLIDINDSDFSVEV